MLKSRGTYNILDWLSKTSKMGTSALQHRVRHTGTSAERQLLYLLYESFKNHHGDHGDMVSYRVSQEYIFPHP